jgi:hypothetical protein
MLLYITSEEHAAVFDFLTDAKGIPIKKFVGEYSLTSFVANDLNKFESYKYLAVDLDCLQDMPEGLFQAIESIKDWFAIKLILYAQELESELREELIQKDVYNLIVTQNQQEAEELILKAVSPGGIPYQSYLDEVVPEKIVIEQPPVLKEILIVEPEKDIRSDEGHEKMILLAGSEHRVGTTSVAIQLANFLANQGKMVAYMEFNEHRHLKQIIDAYRMRKEEVEESIWHQLKGVDYFFTEGVLMQQYDYLIFDLGVLTEDNLDPFGQGDLRILCGASKCFERGSLNRRIKMLKSNEITEFEMMLSFVSKEEQETVQKIYPKSRFTHFSPNLMGWQENQEIFKSLEI